MGVLVEELFPLATVVTPTSTRPARCSASSYSDEADRRALAEALHAGRPAVIVTGGHGAEPVDWLFDGERHVAIPVERYGDEATHGAGCTHSASLAALLARGEPLEAARGAAAIASEAVRNGLADSVQARPGRRLPSRGCRSSGVRSSLSSSAAGSSAVRMPRRSPRRRRRRHAGPPWSRACTSPSGRPGATSATRRPPGLSDLAALGAEPEALLVALAPGRGRRGDRGGSTQA